MRVPDRDQSADEVGYAVDEKKKKTNKTTQTPHQQTIPTQKKIRVFFPEKLVVVKSIAEGNKPSYFFQ